MKKNFVKSRWLFTMLLFVTTMIMPTMMLAQGITPTKPKGNGRAEPYLISNAAELYWFAGLVNGTLKNGGAKDLSANAILTKDIIVNKGVLDEYKNLVFGKDFIPWTPIGTSDEDSYSGIFNGQGHTISGLYFNDSGASNVGLFGCIYEGKILNVGVLDSYFQFGTKGGGVCGKNYEGILQNCSNSSTVIGKNDYSDAGGVCGDNYGTVRDCKNTGSVSGENTVGGVCGFSTGTIESCYNTGSVSGEKYVGGVIGSYINGTITNCYYLENTATGGMEGQDVPGKAEEMSEEQFASGEVAYLLAEALGEQVWGQQLGKDRYPVLYSDYKVIKAAKGDKDENGNEDTYWATFSNQTNDATLSVPSESGRTLNVYNATVSGGKMTLTQRNDNQVAKEEGVLLKTNGEYVNAKANEKDGLLKVSYKENHLVATPAVARPVTANGYILYRLTYKNEYKDNLGFYLGSSDGKSLKAIPGKAYLKVSKKEATAPSSAALTRSFVFGGGSETTGIDEITIMGTDVQRHGTIEGIFDLQGRKISNPTKGIYIKNNKKVIIK